MRQASHWDGADVTDVPLPTQPGETFDPAGLDCTSDDHCLAVGQWTPSLEVAAAVWDGTSWNALAPTAPMTSPDLVACSSSYECVVLDGLDPFYWSGHHWGVRCRV